MKVCDHQELGGQNLLKTSLRGCDVASEKPW